MPVYLRYGKFKGEVKKPPAYRGWIELRSTQLGEDRRPKTSHSVSGEASRFPMVSEIIVTKPVDSVSALFAQEAIHGEGVVAIVDFVKDGHVYLRYTLTGTMISDLSVSGRHGEDEPTESVRLNFQKIKFEQTPGGPPPPP